MWKPIDNCDQQIALHTKLREPVDDSFQVYEVIGVEFDQYKLELVSRSNEPVSEKIHNVLNCEQLSKYHFEIEEQDAAELAADKPSVDSSSRL